MPSVRFPTLFPVFGLHTPRSRTPTFKLTPCWVDADLPALPGDLEAVAALDLGDRERTLLRVGTRYFLEIDTELTRDLGFVGEPSKIDISYLMSGVGRGPQYWVSMTEMIRLKLLAVHMYNRDGKALVECGPPAIHPLRKNVYFPFDHLKPQTRESTIAELNASDAGLPVSEASASFRPLIEDPVPHAVFHPLLDITRAHQLPSQTAATYVSRCANPEALWTSLRRTLINPDGNVETPDGTVRARYRIRAHDHVSVLVTAQPYWDGFWPDRSQAGVAICVSGAAQPDCERVPLAAPPALRPAAGAGEMAAPNPPEADTQTSDVESFSL